MKVIDIPCHGAKVIMIKYDGKRFETPGKYVEYLQMLSQDVLSLNAKVGDTADGEIEFGDLIECEELGPDEIVINKIRQETLSKIMKETLSPRERKVMFMRFGFETGSIMTLEEIGEKYHVTRERIRQIESHALLRLKKAFKKLNIKEGDI